MKQSLVIILIFSFVRLYAQTDKNYIVRTNLGYNYVHKDMIDAGFGVTNQNFGEINQKLSLNLNAGRRFGKSFIYGLGLGYNFSKQEFNPEVDRPQISGATGFGNMTFYSNSVITSRTVGPAIFIQYFSAITDRLTIAFDGFAKYEFTTNQTKNSLFNSIVLGQPFVYSNGYFKKTNLQRLGFGILPSVRYNILKNAGLELTYGLLQYTLKINDSRMDNSNKKTKTFDAGFKPENWLIGFYLKL